MLFKKIKALYKGLRKFDFIKDLHVKEINSEEKVLLLSKLNNIQQMNGSQLKIFKKQGENYKRPTLDKLKNCVNTLN